MSLSAAIGIDLGTSSAALACIDDVGRSALVRNSQGELLIPSIVYFEDEELVFGGAARQAAAVSPQRTAECVKRDLGQASYSRAIGGQLLPTPFIEACQLAHLLADAPLGSARPAVVLAIPSCFHQGQRAARLQAAEIAGVDVRGTIDEPIAAALALAENQGYLKDDAAKSGCRVLVFDLGGGKLDVALVELKPRRLRTLAVGGNSRLGGREWDVRLADVLGAKYAEQFGEDPRYDIASVRRLQQTAEETKHALSTRQQARVHVERNGRAAEIAISREAFEEITAGLVDQARAVVERVLADAGLAWRDISQLLLVGGATRMPMIGRMLEQLTGLKPTMHVHPDEAVARGAALAAEQVQAARSGKPAKNPCEIVHLTSRSLGVEWLNQENGQRENVVLIPRGAEMPCSTQSIVTTESENQTAVTLQVLEGEQRAAQYCERVAEATIGNLPSILPLGSRIEVQYGYEPDGRLALQARMTKTMQALAVTVTPTHALPADDVARCKQLLTAKAGLTEIHRVLGKVPIAQAPSPIAIPQPAVEKAPLPQGVPMAASGLSAHPYDEDEDDDETGRGGPPPLDQVRLQPNEDLSELTKPKRKGKPVRSVKFHIINIAGFVVFSALGLAIGYYMLKHLDFSSRQVPQVSSPVEMLDNAEPPAGNDETSEPE